MATIDRHYVTSKRVAKADRLARVLRTFGATAEDVASFEDADRRMIEADAAVRRGSGATWRLVADMLAGSMRPEALCPTCGIGDPDGVEGARQTYDHPGPCTR